MHWLSRTGWPRVFLVTILGTAFCVAVALYVDSFNFPNLSEEAVRRAVLVNVFVPTFLAGPLLFVVMYQMRQLAIAHRELQIIAATDSLTKVLNRGAFTMLVEAYLERADKLHRRDKGALLVIDADHFKSINDRYGHERGDHALKIIAGSIQRSLREADLVGRIGGEEFAAFLPGADVGAANIVAERIRTTVSATDLQGQGIPVHISVSVGGAVFDGPISFDRLYIAADGCLYGAKSEGRDRVKLCLIPAESVLPAGALPGSATG